MTNPAQRPVSVTCDVPAPAGVRTSMLELRIHGRGGQGAQVGCQMLATAFFRAGRSVQAFAAYGGERRGAPVTASVRVDTQPIHLRCDVGRAGAALVLDASLLPAITPASLAPDALLVVNTTSVPASPTADTTLVTVDATAIAREHGLGPIVATAVLGAFAGATRLFELTDLLAAVEELSPVKKAENVAACAAAYAATVAARAAPP